MSETNVPSVVNRLGKKFWITLVVCAFSIGGIPAAYHAYQSYQEKYVDDLYRKQDELVTRTSKLEAQISSVDTKINMIGDDVKIIKSVIMGSGNNTIVYGPTTRPAIVQR